MWKGIETESLEYCSINYKDTITVKSSVLGHHNLLPFKLDYEIELGKDWVVRTFRIRGSLFNMDQHLALTHDGAGRWFDNNKEWKHLEGCLDIDISVTPMTNTLPINRLKPFRHESEHIEVAYIDILEFKISKEQQTYTALPDNRYRFTNGTGDFSADITVDEDGLVSRYPGLFECILIRE